MRKSVVVGALLLAGAGCHHAAPFIGPNGAQGYSVDCSGTAVSMASCYKQASNLCPGGYEVIGQQNQRGLAPVYGVGVMATSSKSLEFTCKPPEPKPESEKQPGEL